jgi:hypothetical protein
MATRDDGPPVKAELDKAVERLGLAMETISRLRDELNAIKDMAYRGVGTPSDALEAIHVRAGRAAVMD